MLPDPNQHANLKEYAKCNYCNDLIKTQLNGITTPGGIQRHFSYKHKNLFADVLQTGNTKGKKSSSNTIITNFFDTRKPKATDSEKKSKWLCRVTNWVIDTCQPLEAVQKKSFQSMFRYIHESAKEDLYVTTKHKIREHIIILGNCEDGEVCVISINYFEETVWDETEY